LVWAFEHDYDHHLQLDFSHDINIQFFVFILLPRRGLCRWGSTARVFFYDDEQQHCYGYVDKLFHFHLDPVDKLYNDDQFNNNHI